ncbi:MAG: outer membrane lipoprotein chaperone LolA [Burkholderiales bacterium]
MHSTPLMRVCKLGLACLIALPQMALASGVGKLHEFLRATRSGEAHFSQSVRDKYDRVVQELSGTMQFVRPGKFRWTYQNPYQQLIIGDGVKLWVYDTDLAQVTVKSLDSAVGSSPAALLAGERDIETDFELKDLGSADGLEWLEAVPIDKESTFERVRIGFRGNVIEIMELRDLFSQTTQIRFSDVQRNPALAAELFEFTPPAGADVIGE